MTSDNDTTATSVERNEKGQFTGSDERKTREQSEIEGAVAILERYVEPTTLAATHAVSLGALVEAKCTAHPQLDPNSDQDQELVLRLVQGVMAKRANDQLTRLARGTVVLDTTGGYGNMGWVSMTHPRLVFAALMGDDHSFGDDVRAAAFYFDPAQAREKNVRVQNVHGEWVDRLWSYDFTAEDFDGNTVVHRKGDPMIQPDTKDGSGYTAIVATFTSISDAEEAIVELRDAVSTLARPPFDPTVPDADDEHVPAPGSVLTAL